MRRSGSLCLRVSKRRARTFLADLRRCTRKNPSTHQPCNITFPRRVHLTQHVEKTHSLNCKGSRCSLCREGCFWPGDLAKHVHGVHPDVAHLARGCKGGISAFLQIVEQFMKRLESESSLVTVDPRTDGSPQDLSDNATLDTQTSP